MKPELATKVSFITFFKVGYMIGGFAKINSEKHEPH